MQGRIAVNNAAQVFHAGNSRGGQGFDGASADGVDADALGAKIARQVAHRGLKSGLGNTHDVVAGDNLGGAMIGHGQHRRTFVQQGFKGATNAGERVGRNVQRKAKTLARGVYKAAAQVFAVGKGHGVHKNIQVAPLFLYQISGSLNLRIVAHVTLKGKFTAELFAQGFNTLFDGFAHIVEGKACALFFKSVGNAVGNASVVGQTQYKSFLSLQQHGSS